jgi:hypothetical protein
MPIGHHLNIRDDHVVYNALENGSTYSGRGEELNAAGLEAGEITRARV